MSSQFMKATMLIIFLYAPLISAQTNDSTDTSLDEAAVKTVVNDFLIAAGNYDIDAMPEMFTANANIGGASFNSGEWNVFTLTLEEFLSALKSRSNPQKYTEPVSKFTVFIEKGKLAFVKADATLIREGKAKSHNFDYFTLLKEDEVWKILNGSYVSVPVDK